MGPNRFCAGCGQPLSPEVGFCSRCGRPSSFASAPSLPGAETTGPLPSPGRFPGPNGRPPAGFGPFPPSPSRDREALGWVHWASVVALVGSVESIAWVVWDAVQSSGSGPAWGLWFTSVGQVELAACFLVAVGFAFGLVEFVFLRRAFVALRSVEPRFGSPATSATVALVALPIVALGAALVLAGLARTLSCSNIPSGVDCVATSSPAFLAGAGLVFLGGITLVIGALGVLIGVWRLGTRYSESRFQVGAILLLVPFLAPVGWVVILLGAGKVRGRISGVSNFALR